MSVWKTDDMVGFWSPGRARLRSAGRTPRKRQASGSNPLTGSQLSEGAPTRAEPSCCDVRLSVRFVTMILMSELPTGDTHDVIHHGGQVVAVIVPIGEYQQLRH